MTADKKPITQLAAALKTAGYAPVTYRRVYNAALSAQIPAQQADNGRWHFSPADVPQIAQAMGLTKEAAQ